MRYTRKLDPSSLSWLSESESSRGYQKSSRGLLGRAEVRNLEDLADVAVEEGFQGQLGFGR